MKKAINKSYHASGISLNCIGQLIDLSNTYWTMDETKSIESSTGPWVKLNLKGA